MTPTEFTYWLQGFMEMADPETLTAEQTQMIKDHLALALTPALTQKKLVTGYVTNIDKILEDNHVKPIPGAGGGRKVC